MTYSSDRGELIRTLLGLAKQGQRDYAERELEYIVQSDPDDAEAWLALAQVSGTRQKAVYCLEQVLRIQPGNQAAANALHRLKRSASASSHTRIQAQQAAPAQPRRTKSAAPKPKRSVDVLMLAGIGMILILGLIFAGSIYAVMNGTSLPGIAQPTQAVAQVVATLTETITPTPSHTPTPTTTFTPTATFTPSTTPTPTSTNTPRPSITPRPTSTPRPTREPQNTSTPGGSSAPGSDEPAPDFGPITAPFYTSTPWPLFEGLSISEHTEFYVVTGTNLDQLQDSLYASSLKTDLGEAWASTESEFNFH